MTWTFGSQAAMAMAGVAFACHAWAQTQPAVARAAEPIRFAKGASTASVTGRLKGPKTDTHVYLVRAKAGQVLRVDLETMSTSTYFLVMPPSGNVEPLFRGDTEPQPHWSGVVRRDGDYRVHVLLNRQRAREGRDATYTLTVTLQ